MSEKSLTKGERWSNVISCANQLSQMTPKEMWEGITKAIMEEEGRFIGILRMTSLMLPYTVHIPVWPDLSLCGDTLEWWCHDTMQYQWYNTAYHTASNQFSWIILIPRPTLFCILWFALTIINGRRSAKIGSPGSIHHVSDVRWTQVGGQGP